MPAALWAIVSMLASMGAWEGGRWAIKGIGRKLMGEAAGKIATSAGKKLATSAVGEGMAKGLTKVPWLAKHLPTVENLPTAAVGAAGGLAGLIGGMKASEYTYEFLNGSEVRDSDNLAALAQIRAMTTPDAAIERMFGGGVQ